MKEKIIDLYEKGYSWTAIAKELNITRGVVAGTVSRWKKKADATKKKLIKDVLDKPSRRYTTCRFPIGEPDREDFSFCGIELTDLTKPYCDKHKKIAYISRREMMKLLKK